MGEPVIDADQTVRVTCSAPVAFPPVPTGIDKEVNAPIRKAYKKKQKC
jgi:hypothetical protein